VQNTIKREEDKGRQNMTSEKKNLNQGYVRVLFTKRSFTNFLLPYAQHRQQTTFTRDTHIHAPDGIQTHSRSEQAAADSRLDGTAIEIGTITTQDKELVS
jgi:hypothetical protein